MGANKIGFADRGRCCRLALESQTGSSQMLRGPVVHQTHESTRGNFASRNEGTLDLPRELDDQPEPTLTLSVCWSGTQKIRRRAQDSNDNRLSYFFSGRRSLWKTRNCESCYTVAAASSSIALALVVFVRVLKMDAVNLIATYPGSSRLRHVLP